jgi:hypothetical protein
VLTGHPNTYILFYTKNAFLVVPAMFLLMRSSLGIIEEKEEQ